ncbi:MAG: FeoB-associated Cys-rich membrane protein [Bacteroidia bacterium]|nr:FeoB-associated Cys-rich membrane protein [Bacteroidia bacterium]
MQEIIIGILFIFSVLYLIRIFQKDFQHHQDGCSRGCGACPSIDPKKLSQHLSRKPEPNLNE